MSIISKKTKRSFDVFLIIAAFLVVFPYIWMFFTSFKPVEEVFTDKLSIFPSTWKFSNYAEVFTGSFLSSILNSFLVVFIGVILDVLISFIAGYAFARMNFYGRQIIFLLILGTLMIPSQVLMLPSYILMGKLGWLNSYIGLIVPRLSPAFGMFLVRRFIMTVPDDIAEAAYLVVAPLFTRIFKIYWPICFPAVTTLGVFSLIGYWNDYYWPLMIISDKDYRTLSLAIAQYKNVEGMGNWSQEMAAAVVATVPMIILFLVARKKLIGNITEGAVKG